MPQNTQETENKDQAVESEEEQEPERLLSQSRPVLIDKLLDQRGRGSASWGTVTGSWAIQRRDKLVGGRVGEAEDVVSDSRQRDVRVAVFGTSSTSALRLVVRYAALGVRKVEQTNSCSQVKAVESPAILVPMRQLTTPSAGAAMMVLPKVSRITPVSSS